MPTEYNLDNSAFNNYNELYQSGQKRSILQEVQFLLNSPFEHEYLRNRLYSISYAWGTVKLGHKKTVAIEEEGKKVSKNATVYITNKPERSNHVFQSVLKRCYQGQNLST